MNQPRNHIEDISHFSGSGKTFFFNKRLAKNDIEYLAINAIWGERGNYEKLVLFPQHYMEFSKHLDKAIENLTGFTRPCSCGNIKHSTKEEISDG